MSYPTITLEEHYFSRTLSQPGKLDTMTKNFPPQIMEKLYDFDDKRISAMDEGSISMQVISQGPEACSCSPEDVTAANDELYDATKANERFAAFGSLPLKDVDAAVREFERCVKQLGFVGVLIDSHLVDGQYYDDRKFWPIFDCAERLDVPVYIHPTFPVPAVKEAMFDGSYEDAVSFALGTSAWGWHSDTGLCVLRLHAAGLFEKYPRVKIVIGHMGEMLPFMLDRIHMRSSSWMKGKTRSIYDVWNSNIWITTSSFFSLDPMACILRNTQPERIMYSVDYPFSETKQGHEFLEKLRTSGMVSQEVFEQIAWRNAEKLLGVKAPTK